MHHDQPHDNPIPAQELRRLSELISVPTLCRRMLCRRSGACRGEPRRCLRECAEQVPEDARLWVLALLTGRDEGLTFDAALERIPEPLTAAFSTWTAGAAARRACEPAG